MAYIISVYNQKGGVAKSTTASSLASFLAVENKQKVLLVDNDSQANATNSVGITEEELDTSIYYLYSEQHLSREKITDCIKNTEYDNLYVLPSDIILSKMELMLVSMLNRERKLQKILDFVETDFDYIIIDCPPSMGLLSVNALVASDSVIIPVRTAYFSMKGTKILFETIDLIKDNFNEGLEILGVVVTQHRVNTSMGREFLDDLRNHLGGMLFNTIIRLNVEIEKAQDRMKPILDWNDRCNAYTDYKNLTEEVLDRCQRVKIYGNENLR